MKKSAESNMRLGVVKKVVRKTSKTSQGIGNIKLPKITGKVLKTIVGSRMKVKVIGKTITPVVSQKQPSGKYRVHRTVSMLPLKHIMKGDMKNA